MTTKMKETLRDRVRRVLMHWDCIVIKVWEKHNFHIMFHVAGIKREVVEAIADVAWGE